MSYLWDLLVFLRAGAKETGSVCFGRTKEPSLRPYDTSLTQTFRCFFSPAMIQYLIM